MKAIEGKKAYAALNGMKSVECPQWRIRMAALKNCLVGSRTILPGGGKLFGSVPPPSPQLWEGFSKYFTVTTYARNFYTKKEKARFHPQTFIKWPRLQVW